MAKQAETTEAGGCEQGVTWLREDTRAMGVKAEGSICERGKSYAAARPRTTVRRAHQLAPRWGCDALDGLPNLRRPSRRRRAAMGCPVFGQHAGRILPKPNSTRLWRVNWLRRHALVPRVWSVDGKARSVGEHPLADPPRRRAVRPQILKGGRVVRQRVDNRGVASGCRTSRV
eukprot:scaffold472_cov109-Isochrysis_galbana.AAC.4